MTYWALGCVQKCDLWAWLRKEKKDRNFHASNWLFTQTVFNTIIFMMIPDGGVFFGPPWISNRVVGDFHSRYLRRYSSPPLLKKVYSVEWINVIFDRKSFVATFSSFLAFSVMWTNDTLKSIGVPIILQPRRFTARSRAKTWYRRFGEAKCEISVQFWTFSSRKLKI